MEMVLTLSSFSFLFFFPFFFLDHFDLKKKKKVRKECNIQIFYRIIFYKYRTRQIKTLLYLPASGKMFEATVDFS